MYLFLPRTLPPLGAPTLIPTSDGFHFRVTIQSSTVQYYCTCAGEHGFLNNIIECRIWYTYLEFLNENNGRSPHGPLV